MTTVRSVIFACACACSLAAVASAQETVTRVELSPGESLTRTLVRSEIEARSAQLRADWVASGEKALAAAPVIEAGSILTPSLNPTTAPATPKISITFQAAAGLNYLLAEFTQSPTGQAIYAQYALPKGEPAAQSGAVLIGAPGAFVGLFNALWWDSVWLYSAPGTWTLSQLFICDNAGTCTSYSESQIASLFRNANTITVTNSAKPDVQAPLVTGGKLLTPTVKRSSANPAFGASLYVSDDISGVSQLSVCIKAPGSSTSECEVNRLPVPTLSGNRQTWDYIGSNAATGTWSITEYDVCDVAGNCLDDKNASDIQNLFGTTTFTVTN